MNQNNINHQRYKQAYRLAVKHYFQETVRLWKLMEGKTAIVIAQRLSTIQKMDRIIVLDNGSIIEDGNHTELLKKHGIYAELWSHQSGGFIED